MKIRKGTDVQQTLIATELAKQDSVSGKTKSSVVAGAIQSELASVSDGTVIEDQVSVGLSSLISDELQPEKVTAEHSQRFEELKKLVQSGNYKGPSSRELAEAVVTGLALETYLPTQKVADEE